MRDRFWDQQCWTLMSSLVVENWRHLHRQEQYCTMLDEYARMSDEEKAVHRDRIRALTEVTIDCLSS